MARMTSKRALGSALTVWATIGDLVIYLGDTTIPAVVKACGWIEQVSGRVDLPIAQFPQLGTPGKGTDVTWAQIIYPQVNSNSAQLPHTTWWLVGFSRRCGWGCRVELNRRKAAPDAGFNLHSVG